MHINEFTQNLDVTRYISMLVGILIVNVLLFRNLAYHRYDPIWIVVMTLSFQLTTPIYAFFYDQTINKEHVIYVALALISFLIGAQISHLFLKTKWKTLSVDLRQNLQSDIIRKKREQRFIYLFLTLSSFLLVLALGVRAATVGLPIFSNNPDLEKLLVNQGGFGVLERIIEPSVNGSLILIYYLIYIKRKFTLPLLIYSLAPLTALLVSGSKGTLLTAYYTFFFTNIYIAFREHKRFTFVSLKVIVLGAIAVMGYAVFVLVTRARGTGVNNIDNFVVQSLLARFIAFSDGIYYYFQNGSLLGRLFYEPSEYIYQYWAVPLLAPLRLVAYPAQSLGNAIISTRFGGNWLGGPNPTMSVEGYVFFGFIGGAIYCFCLGILFSFCRRIMLKIRTGNRLKELLLFCIGNLLSMKITGDMLLFAASIFDYSVVITFTFLVGCLIYTVQKYAPYLFFRSKMTMYTPINTGISTPSEASVP